MTGLRVCGRPKETTEKPVHRRPPRVFVKLTGPSYSAALPCWRRRHAQTHLRILIPAKGGVLSTRTPFITNIILACHLRPGCSWSTPTTQSIANYVHTMLARPHRQAGSVEDEVVELVTMTPPTVDVVKPAPQRMTTRSSPR